MFIIASALLLYSDLTGGALLALAVSMQLALLFYNFKLSLQAQLGALKLFFISIPLFFFWGGVHSFVTIYFTEGQHLFFLMALTVSMALTLLLTFQVVFSYAFLEKNNFELIATLQDSFNEIHKNRAYFLKISSVLFVFSLIPCLSSDWKLVFAVTVTHLYLNRDRLRPALLHF
jgi:hypothetical protein